MTRTTRWYVGAAAVFAAGLAAFIYEAFRTPERMARLRRRQHDFAMLQELAASRTDVAGIRVALKQLPTPSPAPLDEAAASSGLQATWSVETKATLDGGWSVLRANATFHDVAYEQLWSFLQNIGEAKQRPPWRLVEITLAAAERGRGEAVLALEALTRSDRVPTERRDTP